MDEASIIQYMLDTFDGLDILQPKPGDDAPEIAWGDTFFIYDPQRNLDAQYRFPFATIVVKDYGDFDNVSNLNRAGVFRLNIGVSRNTYQKLLGPHPAPPGEAGVVNTGHDFAALDQLMPHPYYAPQSWVCVLNPSDATFETLKPLLAEAYQLAVGRARSKHA